MPQDNNRKPVEAGEQVPTRPHDAGSQATKPLTGWTRMQRRYGTQPRTRLPALAPAMSRKRRCLTGRVCRRKFSTGW
jgi:hypothetical protein